MRNGDAEGDTARGRPPEAEEAPPQTRMMGGHDGQAEMPDPWAARAAAASAAAEDRREQAAAAAAADNPWAARAATANAAAAAAAAAAGLPYDHWAAAEWAQSQN